MTVMLSETAPAAGRRAGAPAATDSPILLTLAWSLCTSGVTTWAVRLVNALAARGRSVTLLVHPDTSVHAELPFQFDRRVDVIRTDGLPPLKPDETELWRFVPRYRDLISRLANRTGAPVVVSPNDYDSSYAIMAALSLENPAEVRVVGCQHTDTEFAAQIQTSFEPMLQQIIGVSGQICQTLRERMPHRAADIHEVPYGVPSPASPARRDRHQGRPLRMIYAGRMDHDQKRITALLHLSDELVRRRIDHRLQLLGDGPASDLVDRACKTRPFVRRLPAASQHVVEALLDRADVFVLGSAYEGLSVAMLEAMARGCVPVVTAVRSGASQVVEAGINGELATPAADADERAVGAALADAVERYLAADPREMSRRAWESVRDRFSVEAHAARVEAVFDRAAGASPRPWPASLPCLFSLHRGAASAAPSYAPDRLRRLLQSLAGKRVALHATGRHTIELGPVLARSPAQIVGFIDDDPALHGATLWGWPIVAAADAASKLGATDVVISSWMFQESIYKRTREVYAKQGVQLHGMYSWSLDDPAVRAGTPRLPLDDDPRWQALGSGAAKS